MEMFLHMDEVPSYRLVSWYSEVGKHILFLYGLYRYASFYETLLRSQYKGSLGSPSPS